MDDRPGTPFAEGVLTERQVLDALPRAIIVTDPTGRILEWNRTAERLYGWRAAEVLGRSVLELLVPEETRGREGEILAGVRAGAAWQGDVTLTDRDGRRVRVWVTDRPIRDEDGRVIAVLGASEDVGAQRRFEQEARDLTDRLRLALEAGGLGTFRWTRETGEVEWDEQLEALYGFERGGFPGTFDAWVATLHPDEVEHVLRTVNEAVADRTRYAIEHRVVWPDGSVHWMLGAGQVVLDGDGEVVGTIGCTADVTERVQAEAERARLTAEALAAAEAERATRARLEFLGRINEALAESHDRASIMANVVATAVPRLGDWCAIYVLTGAEDGRPEIAVAHVDPDQVAYAHDLQRRFPYDPAARTGIPHVIRTGATQYVADIDADLLASLDLTDDEREELDRLGPQSSIAVPLRKHGRVLGALHLVMAESGRRYTPDDVVLARTVADRVASSLENARLTDHQRAIAATLQASLLPDSLPVVPGVQIAVRYWAAGEGTDVGGDFYDVFPIDADHHGLVIGDVCGTGPAAAAITGLARHTIAGAAWHGDGPEAVLRHLNTTMLRRTSDSFCTVVYGTLAQGEAGLTVTLTSAGHPLPVLARADGTVEAAARPGTLIGVFDAIALRPVTTTLRPGDTLVLFTDGVTDVAPPYMLDEATVAAMVCQAAVAGADADAVADLLHLAINEVMPIEERADDIAVMVLRVPASS